MPYPASLLERDALAVANALRRHGVGSGDRVLVKADNSMTYVAAVMALLHRGASIALVEHDQTAAETRRRAAVAEVDWAILDDQLDYEGRGRLIHMSQLGAAIDRASPSAGNLGLGDWAALDDALLLWSSGSTAVPKAIIKSGVSVLDNLRRSDQRMRYEPTDILLPLLPFSHWYGLSLIILAWMSRAALLVTTYRRLPQVIEIARSVRPTAIDGAPAAHQSLIDLLERRPDRRSALESVRLWCTGGAPAGQFLRDRLARVTDQPLLDGYGSTEAGNIALATADRPIGCGLPLDGVKVWIEGEYERAAAPGEVGEIVLASPDLMNGYLLDTGDMNRIDRDRYHTDDIGFLDAAGNVHVLGRRTAVHRLGHTIYPAALEHRAEAIGQPVKVVPFDEERRGCRLVFVVEDPAMREARHWRRQICAVLPAYEHPNHVMVVEAFPINANGKVNLTALRQLVADEIQVRGLVSVAKTEA